MQPSELMLFLNWLACKEKHCGSLHNLCVSATIAVLCEGIKKIKLPELRKRLVVAGISRLSVVIWVQSVVTPSRETVVETAATLK